MDTYVVLSLPARATRLPSTLTAAERDVAERLLAGGRPAAIAAARGTSIHTVQNQLRSIYEKVGVGSREELLSACLRS